MKRLDGQLRRDEVGVGVGEAEPGRVGGGVVARAQHPHLRSGRRLGCGLEVVERLGDGYSAGHEGDQILDLGGVVLDAQWIAVGKRRRSEPVAARRAPDTEVDAPRIEHLQQAEVLGHLER